VYTFVGSPDRVIEGALNAAKTAYKLIDMTKQKGEHRKISTFHTLFAVYYFPIFYFSLFLQNI